MSKQSIIIVILVSALTSFVTTLAGEAGKSFLNWLRFYLRKLKWDGAIPKGYPNRELIVKLKPNSIVRILNKRYIIKGFNVITHGKEKKVKRFQFWLIWLSDNLFNEWRIDNNVVERWLKCGRFEQEVKKGNIVERWLEFGCKGLWTGEIVLWADWSDREFWSGCTPRRPDIIPKETLRNLKSNRILVGDVQIKIISRRLKNSKVETLWGRWSSWEPPNIRMEYHFVDGIAEYFKNRENFSKVRLTIDGREFTPLIRLESYADEEEFADFSIGIKLNPDDIEVLSI